MTSGREGDRPSAEEALSSERLADLKIVQTLRMSNFDRSTKDWKDFASAMIDYGHAVLVPWAATGELFVQARKKGIRGVPTVRQLRPDDARAFTVDLLLVSIENFRTKSIRVWDPGGGASLSSFFIGRCFVDLPDVYRGWCRREKQPFSASMTTELVDDGRNSLRPAEQAEAKVLTDQLLAGNPVVRAALALQAEGYSIGEIATRLGATPSAVRSSIYHFRKRLPDKGEIADG